MGFSNKHYKDIINSAKVELDKWNATPEDFKKRSIEMGIDLGKWYTDMIKACEESIEPEAATTAKEPEDDNHFGEEQTEGLADLLAELKDSPHDSRWGELTPDNTENLYMSPEELSKRREEDRTRWAETDFKAGSPEHLAYIEKQNPGTLEKWVSNKMKEAAEHLKGSNEHFGEEQAEGLDNLLAGLKDGPKDERW